MWFLEFSLDDEGRQMASTEHKQHHQRGNAFKDLVSGTMGGIAQVLAGHPLDTGKSIAHKENQIQNLSYGSTVIVKVRLQTQALVPGQEPEFRGMIDCFKKVFTRRL